MRVLVGAATVTAGAALLTGRPTLAATAVTAAATVALLTAARRPVVRATAWVAGRDPVPTDRWWAEQQLLTALTAAGILKAQTEPRMLSRRGKPQRTPDGDVSVKITLPSGATISAVRARHEPLAAELRVPATRLEIGYNPTDPPNQITLTVLAVRDTTPRRAAVATAARTNWRDPVTLGRDLKGRAVTFLTRGTHSVFVGGTGSGKTWSARAVVAHAILDPAVTLFGIIAKDDVGDWRPMAPLCRQYVGGVGAGALSRVEAVLVEVEQISESRADTPDAPYVVVVIEEWFRVRSAAQRADPALAKRLDSLLAELLATSRSRNVHIILCVQRGTIEYLPGDQKANLLQRLVGRTGSAAEARYVLDNTPTSLPSRAGQFLHSIDEQDPQLVDVDKLDDDDWKAVCARGASLRGTQVTLTKPTPQTLEPAPLEPVDPLLEAVMDALADGPPKGMPASELLLAVPQPWRPDNPIALGKALRALASTGAPVEPWKVGDARVWRLKHPSDTRPAPVRAGASTRPTDGCAGGPGAQTAPAVIPRQRTA